MNAKPEINLVDDVDSLAESIDQSEPKSSGSVKYLPGVRFSLTQVGILVMALFVVAGAPWDQGPVVGVGVVVIGLVPVLAIMLLVLKVRNRTAKTLHAVNVDLEIIRESLPNHVASLLSVLRNTRKIAVENACGVHGQSPALEVPLDRNLGTGHVFGVFSHIQLAHAAGDTNLVTTTRNLIDQQTLDCQSEYQRMQQTALSLGFAGTIIGIIGQGLISQWVFSQGILSGGFVTGILVAASSTFAGLIAAQFVLSSKQAVESQLEENHGEFFRFLSLSILPACDPEQKDREDLVTALEGVIATFGTAVITMGKTLASTLDGALKKAKEDLKTFAKDELATVIKTGIKSSLEKPLKDLGNDMKTTGKELSNTAQTIKSTASAPEDVIKKLQTIESSIAAGSLVFDKSSRKMRETAAELVVASSELGVRLTETTPGPATGTNPMLDVVTELQTALILLERLSMATNDQLKELVESNKQLAERKTGLKKQADQSQRSK